MTTDQLSEMEEARRRECENDIKVSFWIQVDRMVTIQKERLYRADYATFSDWLLQRFPQLTSNGKGISESTFRQWKASWKAYTLAKTQGVELSNENAARELRRADEALRVLIINKAVELYEMRTGAKPERLTAAMIVPAAKIVTGVIETASQSGHVDTGDGTMSAFDGSLRQAEKETILRQQQHMVDGAKKRGEWSEPKEVDHYWEGETIWFTLDGRAADLPEHGTYQIKLRIVEESCPDCEQPEPEQEHGA